MGVRWRSSMEQLDVLGAEARESRDEPRPEVSVVVTLFDEVATVDELYSRAVVALESLGRPFELVFVDDGSTHGAFAALERLHDAGPRVHAGRLERAFRQHPPTHAGSERGRGAG